MCQVYEIFCHQYLTQVKCSVRGDLGPACNSAGMIDRYVLGIDHVYTKPVYRNLKVSYVANVMVYIQHYAIHLSLTKISNDRSAICPMAKFQIAHLHGAMLLLILKVF